jgi:hypothetical protein
VSKARLATGGAGLLAAVACALALAAPARSFDTGLLDPLFTSSNGGERQAVFDEAKQARAGTVRLNLIWRAVAASKPADPADPADPAYNFGAIDAAVEDAAQRGLRVLLTITSAPNFAEGANRPGNVAAGTWKPKPKAFGQFARAVAKRYSGSFSGLPRVRYLQAWNEANLDVHLSPQYVGRKSFAPSHYREMLNAFYRGVHAVQPKAKVVSTGTAPYGDQRGGARTRPLTFWRKVFCDCKHKPHLDVLAHHPINTSGGPHRSAVHPADASTPDFKNVRRILRKAERAHQVKPGGHRPLWATELWWESKPPDRCGVPLKKHARWIKTAIRLLRHQGASTVIYLSVRDQEPQANECGRERLQAGLEFANGEHKPAFRAFRRASRGH